MRAAYLRTAYEAGGVVVRIGRRSAAMDALLRGRHAAFITAWNPMSRRRPRGWAERHLLVAGDPRALAVLARRFRQAAVVAVAPGRAARLVMLRSRA